MKDGDQLVKQMKSSENIITTRNMKLENS